MNRFVTRTLRHVLALAILNMATAGTLAVPGVGASPRIDTLSTQSIDRSGRLLIFGTNFGTAQDRSRVLIDGRVAIATTWTDTEIHAYVPEATSTASVTVTVVTGRGSSNTAPINVTLRRPGTAMGQSGSRVRWRFQMDSYFSGRFIARAPDGTIYASDISRLYALTSDGGLLWVATLAGGRRPISLAADGTIYTAGNMIKAINPDGTLRWQFLNPAPGVAVIAGPNVGPDGNIYAAQDTFHGPGLGPFSLDPEGNLRWSDPDNNLIVAFGGSNSDIVFGTDRIFVGNVTDAGTAPILTAFEFDGNQLWSSVSSDLGLLTGTFPKMDPSGRIIVEWGQTATQAINPDGSVDWLSFPPNGGGNMRMPGIGPDGAIYTAGWLGLRLWAINPDGSTRWALPGAGTGQIDAMNVPPDGSIILVGGLDTFGQPGWTRGYDTADGALLWQVDLAGEGGIQQYVNSQQPVFTPDSLTAYFPTAFLSDVGFSYIYAIDLSLDLDIDGDGVIDLDDNCVAEFNPDQADGDGDGIGDVCDSISDACTWAIDLCPGTITGSTVDQTNDGASSCNDFPALNKDVWYAYTPQIDGTVTVDTCGSTISTIVSVHSGCPGTIANEIVCDNSACSFAWGVVSFNAVAGQTYLIRLTGWSSSSGNYTLALTGPPCDPGGSVPGDIDGDGMVGILDFLAMLAAWGPCPDPPTTCPADLDSDGTVGILDFLTLLGNWG
ncbi:MAG: PQQ-binding-like beta-propeller repeat protein [Planctomycetes bacterium]|nr:PQQ-binding-like beta-propeller repeat protein [Planctomycetota bacterium]